MYGIFYEYRLCTRSMFSCIPIASKHCCSRYSIFITGPILKQATALKVYYETRSLTHLKTFSSIIS
jgi:hypothetical protein